MSLKGEIGELRRAVAKLKECCGRIKELDDAGEKDLKETEALKKKADEDYAARTSERENTIMEIVRREQEIEASLPFPFLMEAQDIDPYSGLEPWEVVEIAASYLESLLAEGAE